MGVARPEKDQRSYYSGYKKRHGIKFQGIMGPDGLFLSLTGPFIGEINDNLMLTESGIIGRLDRVNLLSNFLSRFPLLFQHFAN